MDGLNRILLYISPLILLGFSLVCGQDAPILELKPTQSTRYEEEGKSFTHYCHVNKAYTPVGPIRWLKNTVTEMKNEPSGIISVINRTGSSGLVFRKVRRTDEGTYTCAVKIEGREVEARAQFILKVFAGISFANVVKNQSADTGLPYTLKCDVSGDPKPQVSWSRNGESVTESSTSNGKYQLTDDGLKVLKVEKTDGGAYECEAEQSTDWTSRSEQVIINLIVNYPPEFPEKEPAKVYAFVGGEVSMKCSADGQPRPTYEWFYKEDSSFLDQPGYVNYDPQNEASYSILVKNMTDKSVFREYMCRARNSLGTVERTFVIHEVDKPSAPQLRSHRVRGNKIEIELLPPNVAPPMNITGYRAMVKPDNTGWENATIIDFNMGKLHFIDSLKHGMNYDIKFAARNEIGLGEFSEIQQTDSDSPLPSVHGYSASAHPEPGERGFGSRPAPHPVNSDCPPPYAEVVGHLPQHPPPPGTRNEMTERDEDRKVIVKGFSATRSYEEILNRLKNLCSSNSGNVILNMNGQDPAASATCSSTSYARRLNQGVHGQVLPNDCVVDGKAEPSAKVYSKGASNGTRKPIEFNLGVADKPVQPKMKVKAKPVPVMPEAKEKQQLSAVQRFILQAQERRLAAELGELNIAGGKMTPEESHFAGKEAEMKEPRMERSASEPSKMSKRVVVPVASLVDIDDGTDTDVYVINLDARADRDHLYVRLMDVLESAVPIKSMSIHEDQLGLVFVHVIVSNMVAANQLMDYVNKILFDKRMLSASLDDPNLPVPDVVQQSIVEIFRIHKNEELAHMDLCRYFEIEHDVFLEWRTILKLSSILDVTEHSGKKWIRIRPTGLAMLADKGNQEKPAKLPKGYCEKHWTGMDVHKIFPRKQYNPTSLYRVPFGLAIFTDKVVDLLKKHDNTMPINSSVFE